VVIGVSAWLSAFAGFVLLPVALGVCGVLFVRRRSRVGGGHWITLLVGNTLLLAFLLSLLFLGLESYYRFFCDETDAMMGTLVADAWYKRHYHRNSFGVRDNIDYATSLTPGKRRVTFVGDSFTAGLGVKNVEDRFVNRIRRLHPEWEVHAIAQPGLETSNEVEAIHNLVVSNHYQLDLLVLVYNINDIGEVMPKWIEGYKKLSADPFRKSWLCRNSYFVNFFYLRRQMRRSAYLKNYFQELDEAYKGPLWEAHKVALTAFVNMTAVRGGRPLVVTWPFLHDPLGFQAAHNKMAGFWQEKHVPDLDLLPVFSNLPPASITVNANDAHPNEHAHALAAEAIDRFLREQISSKR
jgi:lysophospholipase L1-like esterase